MDSPAFGNELKAADVIAALRHELDEWKEKAERYEFRAECSAKNTTIALAAKDAAEKERDDWKLRANDYQEAHAAECQISDWRREAKDAAEARLASVYEECAKVADGFADLCDSHRYEAAYVTGTARMISLEIRRLAARHPASNSGEGGGGVTMKVKVYHAGYGCGSGCCGHIVELDDGRSEFKFTHPYGENEKSFARKLAEETIKKHWPECLDSVDWNSMEVTVSDD